MNHILIDIQLEAVCPNLWAIQESKAMIAPKFTITFEVSTSIYLVEFTGTFKVQEGYFHSIHLA
jgi:hypothetical protein